MNFLGDRSRSCRMMSSRTRSVAVAVRAIVCGPAERVQGLSDAEVIGTKVVAPLGDAVGFIHGHERYRLLAEGADERPVAQPFGGGIHQLISPGGNLLQNFLLLPEAHEAVNGHGGKIHHPERIHLVFHQGDQGRDHQASTGENERGNLVADRLSGAGGHDREGILAREDRFQDRLLPRPEIAEPETLLHEIAGPGKERGYVTGSNIQSYPSRIVDVCSSAEPLSFLQPGSEKT